MFEVRQGTHANIFGSAEKLASFAGSISPNLPKTGKYCRFDYPFLT
jgi:hypothetical protein